MPMDKKRYPTDWDEIARRVKDEADWRCEECGKQCRRPGEPFKGHRFTLTVAHLNHTPEDCRRENLRALCAPCHLRYDAQHHAETRRHKRTKQTRLELDMTPTDITKRFTYHAPKGDQPARYELIRDKARELAELMNGSCPESREKSLAMTRLEEAVMWANASIARNEENE